MAKANRESKFMGRLTEWAVNDSKGGFPQFVGKLSGQAEWVNGDWVALNPFVDETIYLNLIYKKDGQPVVNEMSVDMLSDALGWDKSSFQSLNDNDWSKTDVQFTTEAEEYNGKTTIKAKYLNNANYSGGVKKAEPAKIKSLDSQYGSILRAVAGTPKVAPKTGPVQDPNRVAAWKELTAKTPHQSADERKVIWKDAVEQYFGHTNQDKIDSAGWDKFHKAVKSLWEPAKGFPMNTRAQPLVTSPISDEPQFKEDDIPFT